MRDSRLARIKETHNCGRAGAAGGSSRRTAVDESYNEPGQIVGTSSTSGNVTTFRERSGRMAGTAVRMHD